MGGKVSVITLNPDMTFRERKKRTDITNINISKHDKPSFVIGRSVFRELLPKWKKLFGRKERNLVFHMAGATSCFEVTMDMKLESHERDIWSKREKEKYINKLTAKSKAEQKAIETWQFFLLAGLGITVLILQLVIARGIRIF